MEVTSKAGGIGGAERNWTGVKRVWNKAHSQLKSEKAEKKVMLYSSTRHEQCLASLEGASFSALFIKEDDECDLDLGK